MNTKNRVIDFLKATQPGQTYAFEHPGNATEANRMIGRMRTMLSRMRDKVRMRGKVIKPIRMELVNIEEHKDISVFPQVIVFCRITLRYADGPAGTELDPLIERQLDAILSN